MINHFDVRWLSSYLPCYLLKGQGSKSKKLKAERHFFHDLHAETAELKKLQSHDCFIENARYRLLKHFAIKLDRSMFMQAFERRVNFNSLALTVAYIRQLAFSIEQYLDELSDLPLIGGLQYEYISDHQQPNEAHKFDSLAELVWQQTLDVFDATQPRSGQHIVRLGQGQLEMNWLDQETLGHQGLAQLKAELANGTTGVRLFALRHERQPGIATLLVQHEAETMLIDIDTLTQQVNGQPFYKLQKLVLQPLQRAYYDLDMGLNIEQQKYIGLLTLIMVLQQKINTMAD